MEERIGIAIRPGARLDAGVFGSDFGEDWVVPRAPVRFLVAGRVGGGAVLTAFTDDGRMVGERFAEEIDVIEDVLAGAVARGLAHAVEKIPPDARSALDFLRSRA